MGLPVLGAAAIGGVAGLLGGGGPDEQTTTTTRTLDPSSQGALDAFRQNALSQFQQFQGGQMNPAMQSFLQNAGLLSGGLAQGLQTGLGGLSAFQNPFEQQVISGIEGDVQRQQAGAASAAGDLAQRSRAFGGSRSAVLQARLQGDIGRSGADRIAQVRQSGFQNSVQQLLSERSRLGQLGLAGTQAFGQAGQFMDQRTLQALGLLGQSAQGGGFTQTQTTPLQGGGAFQNFLGGALGGVGLAGGFGGGGGGRGGPGAGIGSPLVGAFGGTFR